MPRIVWLHILKSYCATKISKLLCVSECTVKDIIRRLLFTRDIQPVHYHHGPSTVFGDFGQIMILRLINENPQSSRRSVQSSQEHYEGIFETCSAPRALLQPWLLAWLPEMTVYFTITLNGRNIIIRPVSDSVKDFNC